MSIAVQHGVPTEVTLELHPGQSLGERQRLAARDLREAAALWRLCWTLGILDIRLRYRGSMLGPFWLTISTGAMVSAMGVLYSELFHISLHEYLPFLTVSLFRSQLREVAQHRPRHPHSLRALCGAFGAAQAPGA